MSDVPLDALDTAQAGLSRHGEAVPEWFDFFDAGRRDGFRGHAYLKFKRFTEASAALRSSAAGLPANAVKQRAVVLTDPIGALVSARRERTGQPSFRSRTRCYWTS